MSWTYCYKLCNGEVVTTNMLYTPTKNMQGDTMCMTWDAFEPYQHESTNLTPELIDFFFEREVKYLNIFKDKQWCPEIREIDLVNKKIFVEWNHESINAIINDDNRDLDIECPDWREQVFNIIKDIYDSGYYKLALYPHCFFINKDRKIKTIDFYSVIERDYPFIERKMIEGIIGTDSTNRFDNSTENGLVNFQTFFEITMNVHLGKTWIKYNPFPDFYNKIVND